MTQVLLGHFFNGQWIGNSGVRIITKGYTRSIKHLKHKIHHTTFIFSKKGHSI